MRNKKLICLILLILIIVVKSIFAEDAISPVVSEIFPPEGYVTDMNDQDISANISDSVGLDISTISGIRYPGRCFLS